MSLGYFMLQEILEFRSAATSLGFIHLPHNCLPKLNCFLAFLLSPLMLESQAYQSSQKHHLRGVCISSAQLTLLNLSDLYERLSIWSAFYFIKRFSQTLWQFPSIYQAQMLKSFKVEFESPTILLTRLAMCFLHVEADGFPQLISQVFSTWISLSSPFHLHNPFPWGLWTRPTVQHLASWSIHSEVSCQHFV